MEYNTMPGWAGSSGIFSGLWIPETMQNFVQKNLSYWNQVDLYMGGAEHAVGHLLYSRFWTKFLYDLEKVPFDEPFQKLVNQGMIGGPIHFLLLKKNKEKNKPVFIESQLEIDESQYIKIACHIDFVSEVGTKNAHLSKKQILDFIEWRPEYKDALFEIGKKKLTKKI